MVEDRTSSADREHKDGQKPLQRLAAEVAGMSSWKKKLLAGLLVVTVLGLALRAAAYFRGEQPRETAPRALDPQAPAGESRGFIDSSRLERDDAGTAARPRAEESGEPLPWSARLGGWMARLGGSFAGGLLFGIFFRAFLKTMAAITALVVAAIAALAWFDVVDADSLRRGSDSVFGWAEGTGTAAKNFLVGVLPSAGSGAAGFFVGLLKK